MTKSRTDAPAWDLTPEYPSLGSPEYARDLAALEKGVAELAAAAARPEGPEALQRVTLLRQRLDALFHDLRTYVSCLLSVDAMNETARAMQGRLDRLGAAFDEGHKPAELALVLASDRVIEEYLAHPEIAPERFVLSRRRMLRDEMLPLPEERLLSGLEVDGFGAWGRLYDSVSSRIRASVDLPSGRREMGLAEAAGLTQSADERERRAAHEGIESAWELHEEAAAAALNSIAGWRLEVYRRRSLKRPVHFLDRPLHAARIRRETLDAMLGAVAEYRDTGRRALGLMARGLGKDRLDLWDMGAPPPERAAGGTDLPYAEAIATVERCFGSVHPEMGSFARMADDRGWIEGRVAPSKRPGAYCTRFRRTRTPRVYMTYTGGGRDLRTLAHELGHAFHGWVMRDLPIAETHYPMTLAETASIFSETLVNDALEARASSPDEKRAALWNDLAGAALFLLNIPARFTFEREVYERRSKGLLSPAELKKMVDRHWTDWYGDSVAGTPRMFWATKLHFYITGLSFYNFPYIFGFLFGLGVYARREKLGAKFFDSYKGLLMDTGRMTAEEVAAKHLGADLTRPDFWREALEIVRGKVEAYAKLSD